ncbi:putative C6 transcription factor [Aspergillus tanneri]|uniref:Zn(2)-C6 fungal-type domain-containing protein n=1 Tax=Aspergillus tanneri TaxID=1220188 RepID=A0A5M9M5K3_9EURO|nr:uncharacterized protein ATNIH1004_010930 [Aspergillus tanneri]KAA8641991.1 hypothetical protein ATNIH1004_010930 [Aspergillus tanneri]
MPPCRTSELKNYSCLACRQRKIKCDRHTPCSNCVKAEQQCSFVPPVRGKRKRTNPRKEGIHAKLKRYEELLRSYGAKIDPSDDSDCPEVASQPDAMDADPLNSSSQRLNETKSKLVTVGESSQYVNSTPWSDIGECQNPELGSLGEAIDQSGVHESDLLFETEQSKLDIYEGLHPSSQILLKLKEIYIDRVDPLMKILHLPTFWMALINRRQEKHSRSLEATIFAFYLATISSLKDEECQNLFQTGKFVLYSRYRQATRQALVNAGFLSTSSLLTLQAYALYMMCVRNFYRCDTLFILSGISIRLARKMGLHQDGAPLGLSPFDSEMRRRLWWHLVYVDFRISEVLGTRPSLDLSSSNTKIPLNVTDDDLSPSMINLPPERNSITSISFCLIRHEILFTLRKFSGNMHFESLSSSTSPLSQKDAIVTQLEDHLEQKYLRYYDPSNPLHTFVSIAIRSSICKMRLFTHSPHQFLARGEPIPTHDRDIVFTNATKLLEYVIMVQEGRHGLDNYTWQMGPSYIWNAVLYLLIEMRRRKTGTEVGRAWELLAGVFALYHYPKFREKNRTSRAVYAVLEKWTLEVWDEYVAALKGDDLRELYTPEYINIIRRCQGREMQPSSAQDRKGAGSEPIVRCEPRHSTVQSHCHRDLPGCETLESYDFPDLLSFETDLDEWVQWEQLLSDGFTHIDGA